jgi:hypothetical protein
MDIMKAITAAMNIEATKADVNKNPEEKQAEINKQLAVLQESGVDELCTMANELVNNRTETDGLLAAAGLDGPGIRHDAAIAGVQAQIAALTEQDEQQDEQQD